MKVVIVTGMSGAGKTTALRALEDLEFYCVDNLPLPLLGRLVELLADTGEVEQAALVVDVREGEFLDGHPEAFTALRGLGHMVEILFLDASDEAVVRRFSETRRRHPLSSEDLRQGIASERELLAGLRAAAELVVDTSGLNVHELKRIVRNRYGRPGNRLGVTFLSFGFKHGLPVEVDIVLDVRFLPNPYFVDSLSALPGTDPQVEQHVLGNEDGREFIAHAEELLRFVLPRFEREGKAYVTVALGCTGGRHRSVVMANELARRLEGTHPVTVRHRDLERGLR